MTSKVTKVTSPEQVIETVTYDYNLQNRLVRVTTSHLSGVDNINDITEYTYNDEGIRVKSYHYQTINGGAREDEETKLFLIDAYNHTGYAQVLEEWTPGNSTPDVTYTIGDDVISQHKTATYYLLYDGHGSTRQLADSSGAITEAYSYDGYGTLLGGNPTRSSPAATSLLYTGEYYDNDMTQYNLRARYYDPLNGCFNQLDPYAGNNEDPQSLHKYLYCQANPINGVDPTGYDMSFVGVMTTMTIISNVISVFLPVGFGVYAAAKAGVSPWEYLSALVSGSTWDEAANAIGIGALTGVVLKQIALSIGKRIFSVIGAIFSLFALINSIGLTRSMAAGNLTRQEIVSYLALTTAVIILSVIVGNALRGPAKLPGKGMPSSEPGIYEFKGKSGDIYVGQSGDLLQRINQHLRSGKLPAKNLKTIRWKPLRGSTKTGREIEEQLRINAHGGIDNLENLINAIGKNRSHLLP